MSYLLIRLCNFLSIFVACSQHSVKTLVHLKLLQIVRQLLSVIDYLYVEDRKFNKYFF